MLGYTSLSKCMLGYTHPCPHPYPHEQTNMRKNITFASRWLIKCYCYLELALHIFEDFHELWEETVFWQIFLWRNWDKCKLWFRTMCTVGCQTHRSGLSFHRRCCWRQCKYSPSVEELVKEYIIKTILPIITSFYRTIGGTIIGTDMYSQCCFGHLHLRQCLNQVHSLVRVPYLSIKASNDLQKYFPISI